MKDIKDIALSQLFPCGWEIRNDRADNEGFYQDIRDDRVYSYFDLEKMSTICIETRLVAAYSGTYWHPATKAEAMYNAKINAVAPGFEVKVVL